MTLLKIISTDLGIPLEYLENTLNNPYQFVKKIKIPKKNGGKRTVVQPSRKIKVIQYWLLRNVLSKMPVHDAATAFKSRASIKLNARLHQNNKYILRLDFTNFFWSIYFKDFRKILSRWHKASSPGWPLTGREYQIFCQICFDPQGRLPIGYPTSPYISNIVMYDFDEYLVNKLQKARSTFGSVVYTRYADDMVFSTTKKGACIHIKENIGEIVGKWSSPKLTINEGKTIFSSASGGSARVTGLKICNDQHITIDRRMKSEVRLLISLLRKGMLADTDLSKLRGYLAFIQDVEPNFYTKLQTKYFDVIGKDIVDS